MIEYKKAQKILTKSKIKIKDELISITKSLNRVSTKDVFSPNNYQNRTGITLLLFYSQFRITIRQQLKYLIHNFLEVYLL